MTKHERAIDAAKAVIRRVPEHEAEAVVGDAIAAYNAVMAEPEPGTVPVRVCIGVSEHEDGTPDFEVRGHSGGTDVDFRALVDACCIGVKPTQYRWATLNVPVWRPRDEPEVKGNVEK